MVLFKCFSNYIKLNSHRSLSNMIDLAKIRNIGISAHIDSGKTTVTERILFYTGKVNSMHEVKGKDGVGAVMDFMELERQRGITIQSAATFTTWKDYVINIIDTPGHVDFTVEVERALRVLDGAVLVLCAVGGVQSQTLTVNRQMNRYSVPRIGFINKLDRQGANPYRVLHQIRHKLRHNAAMLQLPIHLESKNEGIIDILKEKAIYFDEPFGLTIREEPIPNDMMGLVKEKQQELIETIANVDEEIGDLFLTEQEVPFDLLKKAIRKSTLSLKFTPIFMGTALKNRGVQPLLDAVIDYLPSPKDVENFALDEQIEDNVKKVPLNPERSDRFDFLALAFKLELNKYGQLTYLRIYQGMMSRGETIVNVRTGKKVRVSRLVRMNAQNMDEIPSAYSGDIAALFGVDCSSGDTFMHVNKSPVLSMESMFIPEPVVSMSITLADNRHAANFMKAIKRFLKEDPTLKMTYDDESKEAILHGMGELHLEIYCQRIQNEYGAPVKLGKPKVAFREVLQAPVKFDYFHKKQSGGAGQYGRVIGVVDPVPIDSLTKITFKDETTGLNIPKNFISSIEKGFLHNCSSGVLTGYKISGIHIRLKDGDHHSVDSSDWAFQMAGRGAMKDVLQDGIWKVIEPVMEVEVTFPAEYTGSLMGVITKRCGVIENSEVFDEMGTINAKVPLNDMFGFAGDIRSKSEGKAEYTMEFSHYNYAREATTNQLIKEYEEELEGNQKMKNK